MHRIHRWCIYEGMERKWIETVLSLHVYTTQSRSLTVSCRDRAHCVTTITIKNEHTTEFTNPASTLFTGRKSHSMSSFWPRYTAALLCDLLCHRRTWPHAQRAVTFFFNTCSYLLDELLVLLWLTVILQSFIYKKRCGGKTCCSHYSLFVLRF